MSPFILDPYRLVVVNQPLLTQQLADGAVLAMPFTENPVGPVDRTTVHSPTNTAGVTTSASGPLSGRCYDFSGANDVRVQVADHANLDVGDVFSAECYYKPVNTSGDRAIMSRGNGAFYLRQSGGNLQLLRSQVAVICTSTVAINNTSTWYHIVVTKNGSTVKLWIDGVDRTGTVSNSTMANNALSFVTACDQGSAGSYTEEHACALAYVAIYPTALTAGQVASHFAATSGE